MAKKKGYCTQNGGDCASCSLSSYGLDCMNVPLVKASGRMLGDVLRDIEAAESRARLLFLAKGARSETA